jgi:hypothetical protein
MTNPHGRRRIVLGAAGLGVAALVAGLSACSSTSSPPPTAASPSSGSSATTVMLDQHTHAIANKVDCNNSAAQPSATPAESGDLTTRISAYDDTASVSVALSDETPPSVDGFAISFKVGTGQYQLPYQATQFATQVHVAKQGKSYTITGTGQGMTPGQSDVRQVTFGIHVTCP